MANLSSAHQQFFQRCNGLSSQFSDLNQRINHKQAALISQMQIVIDSTVTLAKNANKNDPIQAVLQENVLQITQRLTDWQQQVASYQAQLALRSGIDDSLLVFVCGKVKAGKSALGNYVVSGSTEPTPADIAQLQALGIEPQFFNYETNTEFTQAETLAQGFRVGQAETTASIQGVHIPGLSFIDSPGLHSVTDKNGELTQKYVEAADLILYPMNSAQPARASDLAELQALIKKGKRILLLLTQSDIYDFEVIDGRYQKKLIMKTCEDQQKQQAYLKQQFAQMLDQHNLHAPEPSVSSVSVRYAELQDNSDEAMTASGMEDFFSVLNNTLDSEAITLKKNAPIQQLRRLYDDLLSADASIAIDVIIQPLAQGIETLTHQQQRFLDHSNSAALNIIRDVCAEIDNVVEHCADSQDSQAMMQAMQTHYHRIFTHYYQPVIEKCTAEMLDCVVQLTDNMDNIGFSRRTKQGQICVTQRKKVRNRTVLAVLGGIGGFFVGGPLGSAVAASLCGAAGDYFTSESYENVTIDVGDNREQVKERLLDWVEHQTQQDIERYQGQLKTQYVDPIVNHWQRQMQQLNNVKKTIIKQQQEIDHV
ncbi:dynamin family protein [Photobacterium toruni]|uniref:Dynamin family protein n=1 Tax=Photobacterium toruni TaxID=1935446 RepID=A0A1T4UGK0_9GAMM|nr:dynamin family protein [Photobacterium toruni]SKA51912.1 Dynamin family protein [Photobacterium toruni]